MTRLPQQVRAATAIGLLLGAFAGLPAPPAAASDHADPINLDRLEGGITDLFVFPAVGNKRGTRKPGSKGPPDEFVPFSHAESDSLVFILCVRRALTGSPPFEGLDQFTYRISADFHSEAAYPADEKSAGSDVNYLRYGGIVKSPEAIDEDFKIEFVLKDDATFKTQDISVKVGDKWEKKEYPQQGVKWYSGVRDDPFIFPQFFGTNVIATVVRVPKDYFPPGRQDFLFWASSHYRGAQIDHVGRSQRTQLPRFDFLNTVHPKDHVRAIMAQRDNPGLVDDFLRTRIMPEFALRPYDVQPDVMTFTGRFPTKFPNGRLLEDDVAALTCKAGDCQLFELSQSHPRPVSFPGGRPTQNDKEFSDTFPYLADPHPDGPPRNPPELTAKNQMLVILIVVVVALVFLFPWGLYVWTVRRLRRLTQQFLSLRQSVSSPPVGISPAPSAAPQPTLGGPQS
jgi:hypothetical protein